jgi:hypothetical protein
MIRIESNQRKQIETLTLDPDQRARGRTYLWILPRHHRCRRRFRRAMVGQCEQRAHGASA